MTWQMGHRHVSCQACDLARPRRVGERIIDPDAHLCNERLEDPDGFAVLCSQIHGTPHSHHDHTARQAFVCRIARITTPDQLRDLYFKKKGP